MSEVKIKPCPFCGNQDIYTRVEYAGVSFGVLLIDLKICCSRCGIEKEKRFELCDTPFDDVRKAMAEIEEDWNKRADEVVHCKDCKYLEEFFYEGIEKKDHSSSIGVSTWAITMLSRMDIAA